MKKLLIAVALMLMIGGGVVALASELNPADINGDGKVDMRDIGIVCSAFGAYGPTDQDWWSVWGPNDEGKIVFKYWTATEPKDLPEGWYSTLFAKQEGAPHWNRLADLNGDNRVDMRDIGIVCTNFGK